MGSPVDDALDRIMALLCSEEVRLNGCACSPGSACYLHGVLVPRALARELPAIDSEELRFFHAAAVEYARAESAEAEVQRYREGLREHGEPIMDDRFRDRLLRHVLSNEEVSQLVDAIESREARTRALLSANPSQGDAAEGSSPPTMPCGHPESSVVSADEGTAYCGECASPPDGGGAK